MESQKKKSLEQFPTYPNSCYIHSSSTKRVHICYKYVWTRGWLRYESSVHERLMKTCRWSMFPESLGWHTHSRVSLTTHRRRCTILSQA